MAPPDFGRLGLILLVAVVVGLVGRRLHFPYSIGLVLVGIVLGLTRLPLGFSLTPELIFSVLLPPLVFEAALRLKWRNLKRDLPVVGLLASLGVLVSAAIVAIGVHLTLGWGWTGSALFGSLIAATDPVSVIAIFREQGAGPRLNLLLESESLLNDGVAAVLFSIALGIALGGRFEAAEVGKTFLLSVGGGVICGAVISLVLLGLAGRTVDHLLELTTTTLAAFASFIVAEQFGMSGILATVVAGLVFCNVGPLGSLSEKGRSAIDSFWEFAAFLANSVVFLLIGGREAEQHLGSYLLPSLAAFALMLLGRAAPIYGICFVFHRTRHRVPAGYQHVLVWGGLRGALGLALALTIPASVPERDAIITVAFTVVALSLFVQGLSMPYLLRRVGATEGAE